MVGTCVLHVSLANSLCSVLLLLLLLLLLLGLAAGGLSDQGRAVIMGERTFGKGVVQYFFPMGDGSGLKLTVAKYLTPKMYDISKNGGLTPDITCKDYPHGEGECMAKWREPCGVALLAGRSRW
jgi:hypothetical protein